jgi:NAD(P)-dependent dehydrogenase (short-subunit alcohol dehydrogenase family)
MLVERLCSGVLWKKIDWDTDMKVNLRSVLLCTKAVLPRMISRKSGKLINVSSTVGKIGPNTSIYALAKSGVMGFTKSLAEELAPLGINVNCINPGIGMTGLGDKVPRGILEDIIKNTPIGSANTPEAIR